MYSPQITVARITESRQAKGMTAQKLNDSCVLNKNTISKSADSKNGLSAKILYDIASTLDCSVDYLLGLTDCMTISGNSITTGNINGDHNANMHIGAQTEPQDEMTTELIKAFKSLSFTDKMEIMNAVLAKSKTDEKK